MDRSHFVVTVFMLIGAVIFLVLGFLEKRNHRKNLSLIPQRVNVNGTRGKSTATRLITAVLAESNFLTVGKTTGTSPRIIKPDAEEIPVIRGVQGPNIGEQKYVIQEAVNLGAEVLVCECMGVNPDYQKVFQEEYLQANLGVIVNVLEDHMDVMGPTLQEVADGFLSTVPYNGKLVIAPGPFVEFFKEEAKKRGTEVFVADTEAVTEDMIKQFNYLVFPENVALALEVGKVFGIDEETAFKAMLSANPDPGAGAVYNYSDGDSEGIFVNAFAVNDADSTIKMIERVQSEESNYKPPIYLMNCRSDRVDRTRQFAKDVLPLVPEGIVIAMGEITKPIATAVEKGEIPVQSFYNLQNEGRDEIMKIINENLDGQLVFGIGNIHGAAEKILPVLTGKMAV